MRYNRNHCCCVVMACPTSTCCSTTTTTNTIVAKCRNNKRILRHCTRNSSINSNNSSKYFSCQMTWIMLLFLSSFLTYHDSYYNSNSNSSTLMCSAFAFASSNSNNNRNNNSNKRYQPTATSNNPIHQSCLQLQAATSSSSFTETPSSPTTSTNSIAMKRRLPEEPIPITILSGFLGCGKTTLLQNILCGTSEFNNELKVAVIVNDVASINIDSKYIRTQQQQQQSSTTSSYDGNNEKMTTATIGGPGTVAATAAGIVELQNGCACCSKSDELLSSIADMVTLNDMRLYNDGPDACFDHIVIELSGIANPYNIRSMFHNAMLYNMPLMDRVRLDTMITVVDSSTILHYINSTAIANRIESPELYNDGNDTSEDSISDAADEFMSVFGMPSSSLSDNDETDEGVAELIVSQIEIADVVIMNKIDLLQQVEVGVNDDDNKRRDNDTYNTVSDIINTLNPRGMTVHTTYCTVPVASILGIAQGQGITQSGLLDDHKDSIQVALQQQQQSTTIELSEPSSTVTEIRNDTSDTVQHCTDPTHDHSHASHDHTTSDCSDVHCTDPTHDHSHASHDHTISTVGDCTDVQCTDPTHDHSHASNDHTLSPTSDCTDVQCTDPTHDHSHASHNHSHGATTKQKEYEHGKIGSFVYSARRPFHPQRFVSFLRYLPIRRGLPTLQQHDDNDDMSKQLTINETTQRMMQQIIRSKGFVWLAHSHVAALYMSQAGTNIDVSCLGSWWATLPRSEWPTEVIDTILQDFDNVDHIEEDVLSEYVKEGNDQLSSYFKSVGDRRQELVFIGSDVGMKSYQENITKLLNDCLLNDMEYNRYCSIVRSSTGSQSDQLLELFPLEIEVRQATY